MRRTIIAFVPEISFVSAAEQTFLTVWFEERKPPHIAGV